MKLAAAAAAGVLLGVGAEAAGPEAGEFGAGALAGDRVSALGGGAVSGVGASPWSVVAGGVSTGVSCSGDGFGKRLSGAVVAVSGVG